MWKKQNRFICSKVMDSADWRETLSRLRWAAGVRLLQGPRLQPGYLLTGPWERGIWLWRVIVWVLLYVDRLGYAIISLLCASLSVMSLAFLTSPSNCTSGQHGSNLNIAIKRRLAHWACVPTSSDKIASSTFIPGYVETLLEEKLSNNHYR